MNPDDQLVFYHKNGYVIIEDAIPPERLAAVQQSYEAVIERALAIGHAERDTATGFMRQHRFQNPHHPDLVHPDLAAAMCTDPVMAFCRDLTDGDPAFFGVAAFAMEDSYDYLGTRHRDSYAARGKDSEKERSVRECPVWPSTQVLLALRDDACLWVVPGSHNRTNTPEEESRF